REARAVAMQQLERALFGQLREQCAAQAIGPRAHGVLDLGLQRIDVGLGSAVVAGRDRGRDARERRLRHRDLARDARAAGSGEQDALDRALRALVVALARQIDEAAVEPAESLAPAEETHALPLLKPEQSVTDRLELVDRRLEQI